MNSREKGKRGERLWRDVLREHGWMARRGQQFAGGPDSPDVICEELDWLHWEVKHTQRLNLWDAYLQASMDAKNKVAVVAHKANNRPWLVILEADDFLKIVRDTNFPASGDTATSVEPQREQTRPRPVSAGRRGEQ